MLFIQPVDVHGHLQCPNCKINIDPCCSGENNQLNDATKKSNLFSDCLNQ